MNLARAKPEFSCAEGAIYLAGAAREFNCFVCDLSHIQNTCAPIVHITGLERIHLLVAVFGL